jgi:hypothetical protein
MLKVFAGLQQRFGGDATHVGTSAAGRWATGCVFPLVDTSDLETELCSADGCDVATRATANNDDVELFTHDEFLLNEQRPQKRGH